MLLFEAYNDKTSMLALHRQANVLCELTETHEPPKPGSYQWNGL